MKQQRCLCIHRNVITRSTRSESWAYQAQSNWRTNRRSRRNRSTRFDFSKICRTRSFPDEMLEHRTSAVLFFTLQWFDLVSAVFFSLLLTHAVLKSLDRSAPNIYAAHCVTQAVFGDSFCVSRQYREATCCRRGHLYSSSLIPLPRW
jgi:hypothetical protein